MFKLRRFINQNKDKIIKILLIVVCVLIIVQFLNYLAKINNEEKQISKTQNNTMTNYEKNTNLESNKSAVSGKEISSIKLEKEVTIIEEFLSYCNSQEFESAYRLLTLECKQQMYNSIDIFKQAYYMDVFNGEKREYSIINWYGDTYKVDIYESLLETGSDSVESKQDYITVKEVDGEYKLNINNYIGYYQINEETTKDDISIEVISKNTYKEHEEYTIKVINKTENIIKLDDVNSTETLYLEDNKGVKYYYYNHELTQPTITIASGQTKEITIKFYNSYISAKEIKYIVFSNIILTNGQLSEKMEFKASL